MFIFSILKLVFLISCLKLVFSELVQELCLDLAFLLFGMNFFGVRRISRRGFLTRVVFFSGIAEEVDCGKSSSP